MKKAALILLPIIAAGAVFIGNIAKTQPKDMNRSANILSTNACIDQALVEIAPEKILALSHFSNDKTSNPFYSLTKLFPKNNGDPEEVLFYNPKLVFTGGFEKATLANSARIIGAKIENFGMPSSIEESKNQIKEIGYLSGNSSNASKLIEEIEVFETKAAKTKISALILFDGANSAGKNTLIDDALNKSGFGNHAIEYGIGNWGKVDIEQLLLNPPDVIILAGNANSETIESRILSLAALKNKSFKIARLPKSYTYCGGPVLPLLLSELQKIRGQL